MSILIENGFLFLFKDNPEHYTTTNSRVNAAMAMSALNEDHPPKDLSTPPRKKTGNDHLVAGLIPWMASTPLWSTPSMVQSVFLNT